MKLIDKSALTANVEKRIKINKACMLGLRNLDYYKGKVDALNDVLSLLNTLEVKEVKEVKEVDLENEFFNWYNEEKNRDYNASILYEKYSTISKTLAKHFFELGLNYKK